MSYAIKHALSEIIWKDGTGVDLPPIDRSSNGWVYRPPEARYPGSGKSFGKGSDGDSEAKKWLAGQIQKAFALRDWELPTGIPKVTKYPELGNEAVQVGWFHPVFGATYITMAYQPARYYQGPRLHLRLNYNVLALDIAQQNIRFHHDMEDSREKSIEPPLVRDESRRNYKASDADRQFILDQYEQFRRNPWTYAQNHLDLDFKFARLVGPHVPLPDVDYSGEQANEDDEVWYKMRGNVDLMFEENAQKYVIENIDTVERLVRAFEFLGFDLNVQWSRSWFDSHEKKSARPTAVSFRVPAKPGVPNREEDHQVRIDETGMSVTCGYVQDEAQYLEYKQRHAMNFFEEVFEEEWKTTETQL